MKPIFPIILIVFTTLFAFSQNNKISTTSLNGTNVDTVLKCHLAGEGVEIYGGRFNNNTGNIQSSNIGLFNRNNANFAFNKGIYMVTGGSYNDGDNNFTSQNLSNIVSLGDGRGAALDFYFLAYADTFAFNYIFASEEYTNYTCSNYNDVFAFILEGWDPVTIVQTTKNVAIVPTTITAANPIGLPVSINTINGGCSGWNTPGPGQYDGTYSNWFTTSYNNSYSSNLGIFNGSTVALSAESKILSCTPYKMHLAISNVSDNILHSIVFIEEGSFYSPSVNINTLYDDSNINDGNVENNTLGDTLIQNCRACDISFSLPVAAFSGNISVSVKVGGNAVLDEDYQLSLPNGLLSITNNSFPFESGVMEQLLHMEILPTAQFNPGEIKNVEIYFTSECCPDNEKSKHYDTLKFYLRGNDSIKLKKENLSFSACDTLKSITMEVLQGTPTTYKYTPTTGILQDNTLSPNTQITTNNIYKLVASDPWGCMTDTAEIEVNIVEKPNFTVSYNPTKGCIPLDVFLQTLYTPDYATLNWTISGENFNAQSTDAQTYIQLPDSGYYSIKLFLQSAPGCVDSVFYRNAIHVSDYPVADFSYSPEEPGNGQIVYFTNTSTGNNITNYAWNFGDGNSSYIENPTHSYRLKESDIKTVTLTVTNIDGCSNQVLYNIPIEDNFALFIPNGFTPNEDGLNDIFLPRAQDVTNYRLEIFSRNGELIFYTTNPEEGWDGKFKNEIVPEGVYLYKIHYARMGNPDIMCNKTGVITVLR